MEEILTKIKKESESSNLTNIVNDCNQAIEIICDKSSLLRMPMNEVRHKCVQLFHSILKLNKINNKLITLTINGLQVIIREEMYWTVSCKEDDQQLPSQVICCVSSTIQSQNESTQVDMLSLITQLSCTLPSLISVDNIEDIIEMCCKQTPQSTNHQMAIEMTASQSCHQFIKYCISSEDTNEDQINSIVNEEIIPLMNIITEKLSITYCNNNYSIAILLKCIQYMFITIPNNSHLINESIVDNIWKVLIPLLIKLSSAVNLSELSMKSQQNCSQQSTDSKQLGRGSESLLKLENTNHYKKHIYKIASELLRLFGRISTLRPALESLFHRLLLYPPVSQRTDALKYMQELLKNTSLIVIASSEPIERFGKISLSKDLDLLHIALDSLEECSLSSDTIIASLSISCIDIFLCSVQSICSCNGLEQDIIERINQIYPNLEDAEFEGFDVRNTKIQLQSSDCNDKESVAFEVLKERIRGYDANDEITDNCEEVIEDKPINNIELNKNLRNFKLESFKSKLSEILKSRSTDSNTDSQDLNVIVEDQVVEKDNDFKQSIDCLNEVENNLILNNDENDEKLEKLPKMESISTNYEEFEDYQRSLTSNTEGPEFEDCIDDESNKNDLTDISRKEDDQQWIQEVCQKSTERVHQERDNARLFIKALKRFLPTLLSYRSSIEADEALQIFASNYCKDLWSQQKCYSTENKSDNNSITHITIVNADGIYLSTYSTLLLNLKLIHSNFYNNACISIPITEQEFIDDIHNSGILVYISSYWLAELYQRVLADNLLSNAGYKLDSHSNVSLINLLTDVDGLDSCQPGAQQLSDYRRLERAVTQTQEKQPQTEAAHKLGRRLLTAFWDTILGCLGTVFRADCNTKELISSNALNILLGSDNKLMTAKKQMITSSLDGLQIAAKLCIQLGLQSRCDTVFELLALSVLQTQSNTNNNLISKKTKQMKRSVIEAIKNRSSFCLHTSHVLSLQVLLSSSLEIGSHCNPCWKYVFKCCQYVMELEHNYFTSRHSSLLTSTRTSLTSLIKSSNKQTDYDLNLSPISEIDMTSMPGINESEDINIETSINNLIAQTTAQSNHCILKDKQLECVIEILSHSVDRLFEDAAQKLNLRSLISFVTELCDCSREQLSLLKKIESKVNPYNGKSLLLFRLSDVILKCAKSGRPLLHFMKCWSVVASHLTETACHCDHSIAKKSISTLHDIINVILSLHNELPHFHFNEALFKPFENLLLLELCDTDVQELIISSICEFVEGTTEEIRSGWRSLFGALRGIRLPPISSFAPNIIELESERIRQLRVILDIFEAFLHTDNLQVFANAAVDCLLCLLRLIKGPPTVINSTNNDESESPDLCLISLKYLHQFSSMLRSMFQMPACPMFSSARKLQSCSQTKLIDTSHLSQKIEFQIEVKLEMLDRPHVKILHVWFLLIDELTQAIETCHIKHRLSAMEMLFNMFKSLIEIPGPNFAIYCTNHILLPSLQRWTRSTISENNISFLPTLRHLCGLTADLVVDNIQLLNFDSNGHDISESTILGINLLLKQSLLVFIECLNGVYHESLAKLSCACIRHILLSVRTHFDNSLWQTTIDCISIAHKITSEKITSLINAFNNKSPNFFDDLDQIKVITKRDSNEDSEQLSRLAQQIFLLDVQRSCVQTNNKWQQINNSTIGDNRSYTFLINGDEDKQQLSISYRVLIIQLNSHWLLIQTLSSLLLSGICPLMPYIQKFVISSKTSIPSILSMDIKQYKTLISLLQHSYRISCDFDSRPGLKFLIQKIIGSEVPSNLYQFSSLVWSVQFITYLYLCCDQKLTKNQFRDDLKQLFIELCDKYIENVESIEANETTIDHICHQSLFFLQASDQELEDIIGCDKVIKNINHNNDNEKKLNLNYDTEDDIRIYRLTTEKKIESLMAEYKRFKTQHSPIPPTITQTHVTKNKSLDKKVLNYSKQEMNVEKDNEKLIIKDGQALIALWSEVITSAIDLHLSLPLNEFKYLIPAFLPSIQILIVYSNNKQLRTAISLWMSKIANNIVENIE